MPSNDQSLLDYWIIWNINSFLTIVKNKKKQKTQLGGAKEDSDRRGRHDCRPSVSAMQTAAAHGTVYLPLVSRLRHVAAQRIKA